MKISCGLNYEKLSAEVCLHLSQNTNFPSNSAVQALISQQSKLNNLLISTPSTPSYASFTDSPCSSIDTGKKGRKGKTNEQVVLYSGKFNVSADNENLRTHLQGMQLRVSELEKICKKMQTQMAKISKSRASGNGYTKSLPKLCS